MKPFISKNALGLAALLGLGVSLAGCNSSGAGNTPGGTGTSGASLDTGATLATVGGESISRGEIFSFLEANAGEAALRQLIDLRLVVQEAKAKNIEITDEEVTAEVTKRQSATPAVAEAVKNGGARLDSLKQQLRSQMAIERLLTNDIKADAAAVNKWLDSSDPTDPSKRLKTRARYDRPTQVKIGILLTSQKARADVMASQLKGGKSFSDVVKEQKQAKDQIAAQSTANTSENAPPGAPEGGYLPLTQLPPAVAAALTKTQVNGITPVLTLQKSVGKAPGVFGIVQLLDRRAESKASATDPAVVMDYKLTQVAQKTIKQSAPNQKLDQVVQGIMQQAMQQAMQSGSFSQPTYRQALDQINQSEVAALLSKLRTSATAKVSIPDKQYESLLASYKPIPAAASPGAAANGASAPGSAPSGAPAADAPAADAPAVSSAPPAGAPAPGSAAPAADAPAAGAPAPESAAPAAGAPAAGAR